MVLCVVMEINTLRGHHALTFDNAISGQVRVPVYAPFSCHLVHTYTSGNTRVYQSDNEVWTPSGLKNVTVSFTHDPNPPTETRYEQGDLIYHTGINYG